MKILLRLFWKARGWRLEMRAQKEISKLKDGEYRLLASPSLGGPCTIPYVSQYASRESAARYVENEELLFKDPKWLDSGAENIDEYVFWAPKLCGMACFKMILLTLSDQVAKLGEIPLVVLAKEAAKAGCYVKHSVSNKLVGLLHAPFLKFAKSFGFGGELVWYVGPNVVAKEILSAQGGSASGGKNNFVIASVHHDIRHAGARPISKQGHLVLVHGFQVSGGKVRGFYIHNPSGFYGVSQENHFVPVDDFMNCFSGRIIVLHSNHGRV